MKTRTRLAAVAASLGAATLAATPVAAQTYDVDAYVFVNASVHSSGSITLLGQTVTWSINLSAFVCASVSLDNADPIIPEIGVCAGIGNGTYNNIVCGTGTFAGTLDATESAGETDTMNLGGTMVSGLAVFNGTSGGSRVVGVADLVPAPGQDCVNGISELMATGTLALAGA